MLSLSNEDNSLQVIKNTPVKAARIFYSGSDGQIGSGFSGHYLITEYRNNNWNTKGVGWYL